MDNNKSCLMMTVGLYTPVDLCGVFDPEDLAGDGIELDSRIKILESDDTISLDILGDIRTILGEDWASLEKSMKESNLKPVLEFFDLKYFKGGNSDFLVLELKRESDIYNCLRTIFKGLGKKYGHSSEFNDFTPYVLLAELKDGTATKYMASGTAKLVLRDTAFDLEDFAIEDNGKQKFLTQNNCIPRFFRQEELRRNQREFEKNNF